MHYIFSVYKSADKGSLFGIYSVYKSASKIKEFIYARVLMNNKINI